MLFRDGRVVTGRPMPSMSVTGSKVQEDLPNVDISSCSSNRTRGLALCLRIGEQ